MKYLICKDSGVIKFIITSLLVSNTPFVYFDDVLDPQFASDPKFSDIAFSPLLSLLHPSLTGDLNTDLVIISRYLSDTLVLHPDIESFAINVIKGARVIPAVTFETDSLTEQIVRTISIDANSAEQDIIKLISTTSANSIDNQTKIIYQTEDI